MTKVGKERKNKWIKYAAILCIFVFMAIPVLFTISKMGVFDKKPTVNIRPNVSSNADSFIFMVEEDNAPFSFEDDNGVLSGKYIEIGIEIANQLGMKAEFVTGTKQGAYSLMKSGRVDAFIGADLFGDANNPEIAMTIPVSHDFLRVYSKNTVNELSSLYSSSIGIKKDYAGVDISQIKAEFTLYDNDRAVLKAVDSGEVEYGIVCESIASAIIKDNNFDIKPSMNLNERFHSIAVSAGNTNLKMALDDVIKNLNLGNKLYEYQEKWNLNNVEDKEFEGVIKNNRGFYILYFVFLVMLATILFLIYNNSREKKQRALQYNLDMAKQASEAKSTFLFNMSHDIRTPMNAIVGFTELAKLNKNDALKVEEYLDKMKIAESNLLSLIDNVLEMARIESGKISINEEATDLSCAIDRIMVLIEDAARKKNITLVPSSDIFNPYIFQDINKNAEVVINIISNSIKYTNPGGKISFSIEQLPGKDENECIVQFTCTDNGIGMSKEFLEEAFDSFSRERTSTVSGIQGTGLGLAIVKKILDLMGGTIEIQSEEGRGTTVITRTPHRFASAEDVEKMNVEEKITVECKDKRILLVEDNELNLEIAQTILENEGFVVETAGNGLEAYNTLVEKGNGYYDVVLMDIQMPVMNGYMAAQMIRNMEDPELSQIPIIAMTANAFEEDKKNALEHGMNGHLSKPININNLIMTLNDIFR